MAAVGEDLAALLEEGARNEAAALGRLIGATARELVGLLDPSERRRAGACGSTTTAVVLRALAPVGAPETVEGIVGELLAVQRADGSFAAGGSPRSGDPEDDSESAATALAALAIFAVEGVSRRDVIGPLGRAIEWLAVADRSEPGRAGEDSAAADSAGDGSAAKASVAEGTAARRSRGPVADALTVALLDRVCASARPATGAARSCAGSSRLVATRAAVAALLRARDERRADLLGAQQPGGLWSDGAAPRASITAVVLREALLGEVVSGDPQVHEAVSRAAAALLTAQATMGSWEGESVSGVIECARALLAASLALDEGASSRSSRGGERAAAWVFAAMLDDGAWPASRGGAPDVTTTATALSFLCEYGRYRHGAGFDPRRGALA